MNPKQCIVRIFLFLISIGSTMKCRSSHAAFNVPNQELTGRFVNFISANKFSQCNTFCKLPGQAENPSTRETKLPPLTRKWWQLLSHFSMFITNTAEWFVQYLVLFYLPPDQNSTCFDNWVKTSVYFPVWFSASKIAGILELPSNSWQIHTFCYFQHTSWTNLPVTSRAENNLGSQLSHKCWVLRETLFPQRKGCRKVWKT